jgi:hypothetical protein
MTATCKAGLDGSDWPRIHAGLASLGAIDRELAAAGVMSRQGAGCFIRFRQETSDQVRRMILDDPRYQEIKARWRPKEKRAASAALGSGALH